MSGLNFEQTHPLYDANLADWEYYRHHFEGGRHFAEKNDYLYQHGVESDASFLLRRQRATDYRNYCRAVVSIFKGHNWAKPPARQLPEALARLAADVTGRGAGIDEFMKLVDESVQVEGHGLILVDLPAGAGGAPYPLFFRPQSVINWRMEETGGRFAWLTLRLNCRQAAEPFMPYQDRTEIYHFSPQRWWRYQQSEQGGRPAGGFRLVAEGENAFGEVPAFWVYNVQAQEGLGESGLKDIAPLCNKLFNKLSLIDEAEYNAGIPILALYTDAEVEKLGLGRQRGIRLNPGEKLEYVVLPPEAIDVIRATCEELRRDIYRIALRRITERRDSAQVETAEAKRLDRQELVAYLRERALNLEEAEARLWRLLAKGLGMADAGEMNIQYNKEFDAAGIREELKCALDVAALEVPSTTFQRRFFEKVARLYLEDLSSEDLARISGELSE